MRESGKINKAIDVNAGTMGGNIEICSRKYLRGDILGSRLRGSQIFLLMRIQVQTEHGNIGVNGRGIIDIFAVVQV